MTEHVFSAPKCAGADGAANVLLHPLVDELRTSVDAAPVLKMSGTPVAIDHSYYQNWLNKMMQEIS